MELRPPDNLAIGQIPTESWGEWKEQFTLYMEAMALPVGTTDARRIVTLRHCMGKV